jgi:ATP-binding cassette subfamily B protein
MFDLRQDIFGRLQRLPVAYFDRNPIGRLVTRVTNDVDALNELFTAGIVSIFGDVVLLVGIVAVLFWLDWRLAIVTFAILPLLLLLTFWFKTRARRSYREVRVRLARINAFLQEHITGMSVVQLFNREEGALADFSDVNDAHRSPTSGRSSTTRSTTRVSS